MYAKVHYDPTTREIYGVQLCVDAAYTAIYEQNTVNVKAVNIPQNVSLKQLAYNFNCFQVNAIKTGIEFKPGYSLSNLRSRAYTAAEWNALPKAYVPLTYERMCRVRIFDHL